MEHVTPSAAAPMASWPVPLAPFVGRAALLDDLTSLLRARDTRLVTLTGPGGVGKTRLALAILERTAPAFGASAGYVSLVGVPAAEAVPDAVARAVSGREPGPGSATAAVAGALGDGPALLVLDNLEHVIDAGTWLLELLAAMPALSILATSREALRLRPERVVAVPPLALPAADDLIQPTEAVELFVACVRAIRPAFDPRPGELATVAEICRRLDGLPLAIELAAARCRALSPAGLLARLGGRLDVLTQGPRDLPDRQRTMRDTIRWSLDLLSPADRAAFRTFGVFAGPFTLDAAEWVMGADELGCEVAAPSPLPLTPDPLDAVSSLLDKSLLREQRMGGDEPRFVMLETIRELAWAELLASPEATAVRDRHAAWFAQRAAASWRALYQDDFDTAWLPRLRPEEPDLWAALAWLEERGRAADLLRMAADLGAFAYFGSHRRELGAVLARASALPAAAVAPPELRAHVAHARGLCAWGTEQALEHFEQSHALWHEAGVTWGETAAAVTLAEVLTTLGRYEEAIAFAEHAAEPAAAWNPYFHSSCLMEVGHGNLGLGRMEQAKRALDAAIATSSRIGDTYVLGHAGNARAFVALEEGDRAGAEAAIAASLQAWRSLGRAEGLVGAFAARGLLALERDDRALAATLLAALERICRQRDYTATALERERIDRLAAALGTGRERAGELPPLADVVELAARPDAPPEVPSHGRPGGLTAREIDVLRLLAEGRTDREIAEALGISRATATRHVANIYLKIDVGSRVAASAWAFRYGVITGGADPVP